MNSLGMKNIEFIVSINKEKIHQLNNEFFKDRPKYRSSESYLHEEESKKLDSSTRNGPPAIPRPFGHSHFGPPPLPFDGAIMKKEEERKGPSALERALMESSHENQESSTLEKLVQEKVRGDI
jgi:hypothetical protein